MSWAISPGLKRWVRRAMALRPAKAARIAEAAGGVGVIVSADGVMPKAMSPRLALRLVHALSWARACKRFSMN